MRIAVVAIVVMLSLGACSGGSDQASESPRGASSKTTLPAEPEATRPWPSVEPGETYPSCDDFATAYRSQTALVVQLAANGHIVEMDKASRVTTELVLANKRCVPASVYGGFEDVEAGYHEPRAALPEEISKAKTSEACLTAWSDALLLRDTTLRVKDSGVAKWTPMLRGFDALQEQSPECFTDEDVRLLTDDASGVRAGTLV